MDKYLKILLDGYSNPNDRKFLSEYLHDELLKANQSPERFYSGCSKAVSDLKELAASRYNKVKADFYKLQMHGSEDGKTYAKSELEQFNPDNYPLNLSHTFPGYYQTIKLSEILFIESAIDRASLNLFVSELNKLEDTVGTDQRKRLDPTDSLVDSEPRFKTEYTSTVLGKIFDGLSKRNVTKRAEKDHFVSIFTNNITGKVFWDGNKRGAKSGLFDLMERLTGKQMKTTDLLELFDTTVDDNNRNTKQTKIIDAVFKECQI